MGLYFGLALRNLVQARRRSLLLGLALVSVAFGLMLLLALSQGITDSMLRSSTTLLSGHINIGGFYKKRIDTCGPVFHGKAELRAFATQHIDGVDFIVDRVRGWGKLVSDQGSIFAAISGIDFNQEAMFFKRLRMPDDPKLRGNPDELARPGTVLIFRSQAERLGVSVGDILTLTTETISGRTNTADLRVVAIAEDVGYLSNFSVFMPNETLRELYGLAPDTTGAIMVHLRDHTRASEALEKLRDALTAKGYVLMDYEPSPFFYKFDRILSEDWTGQRLDLSTWEDELGELKWILSALDSISFFMTSILLGIIAIGIMNAMWMAVRERRREIGTLRAIGLKRWQVLFMFLSEAAMLGFGASALGCSLALLLAAVLNAVGVEIDAEAFRAVVLSNTLTLTVQAMQVVWAVAGFTLVAAAAAVLPALRAAKLQPITAIHQGL